MKPGMMIFFLVFSCSAAAQEQNKDQMNLAGPDLHSIDFTHYFFCYSPGSGLSFTSDKKSFGSTARKGFPYKSFIFPSVLVAYGIFSLNTNALLSVNYVFKEEIYTKRTSKQRVHIDNYLPFLPVVAVYGLNALGIEGKNNFRDRTLIFCLSGIIMGTAVFSIKDLSGETRPDGSDKYSFPSGHAAAAFATAEFLRQEYKDVSPWYGVAGYAVAATTGYFRMYNNKHWMGDIAAGAGIGIISTKLAYWIYPVIKRALFKNKELSTVVMPVYQDGSFGFGLVHRF